TQLRLGREHDHQRTNGDVLADKGHVPSADGQTLKIVQPVQVNEPVNSHDGCRIVSFVLHFKHACHMISPYAGSSNLLHAHILRGAKHPGYFEPGTSCALFKCPHTHFGSLPASPESSSSTRCSCPVAE